MTSKTGSSQLRMSSECDSSHGILRPRRRRTVVGVYSRFMRINTTGLKTGIGKEETDTLQADCPRLRRARIHPIDANAACRCAVRFANPR